MTLVAEVPMVTGGAVDVEERGCSDVGEEMDAVVAPEHPASAMIPKKARATAERDGPGLVALAALPMAVVMTQPSIPSLA
jgi:hypothetical protein